jgi:hypothetical protein
MSFAHLKGMTMRRKMFCVVGLICFCVLILAAQEKLELSPVTKSFIVVDSPVALQHVRVIDGTGAPAMENQTVVVESGLIREIGSAASVTIPKGARVLDLTGRSVIPGLVGMHDHMFYPAASGSLPLKGHPRFTEKWASVFRGFISLGE